MMRRTSTCWRAWWNGKSPAGRSSAFTNRIHKTQETCMELVAEYGLFLAKAVTVVVAIGLLVGWLASVIHQARSADREQLEVRNVNKRLQHMANTLHEELLTKRQRKTRRKQRKAEEKRRAKEEKLGKSPAGKRLFVLDFIGDVRASAVDQLRDEMSGVLQVAEDDDEVLLRLESAGGMVHGYGLAASQLKRLRDNGLRLTVAVDKLAASGGYMMACVGERIVAAPFAIIGSIGVVAQIPNFNRVLRDKHIDYELHTAGDHKRTLTVFGENTDEARAKFREELDETHGLFKTFVARYRSELDIDAVATGEHWHGTQALERKLIDDIATSDDLLLKAAKTPRPIFEVHYKSHTGVMSRVAERASASLRDALHTALSRF